MATCMCSSACITKSLSFQFANMYYQHISSFSKRGLRQRANLLIRLCVIVIVETWNGSLTLSYPSKLIPPACLALGKDTVKFRISMRPSSCDVKVAYACNFTGTHPSDWNIAMYTLLLGGTNRYSNSTSSDKLFFSKQLHYYSHKCLNVFFYNFDDIVGLEMTSMS